MARRHTIACEVFGTDRDLVVHLSQVYEVSGRSYPVLYFLGSNFGERFAMVAATLDYMCGQGQIPEIVLAGTASSMAHRTALRFEQPVDEPSSP